jgi:hypothetical protein
MADLNTRISDFVWKNLSEKHVTGKVDPFWESLRNAGTELWLDTGDMDEAEAIWTSEMSALTTNNTLLNNEIQKGIYDIFISEAKSIVRDLPHEDRVKEIAFILNARHGLRLAHKFGGYVSVELHTDTAHDIKAIQYYGKRYHEICPEQFIVKVPYTAEGLIGARLLKDSGVKINFTLEFSARENVLVTKVARPDYLNVFLAIGLFLFVFKYGCNPQYKDRPIVINEAADSNAIYDHLEAEYSNQIIKLYDSIEFLNKHVKTAKTIYKTKIVQVWSDSVVTTNECSEVVEQANAIILSQDTLIKVQSRSLIACNSQVGNLKNQVELNKGYADILLKQKIELIKEYDKINANTKRNKLLAGIVAAILVSFSLIK